MSYYIFMLAQTSQQCGVVSFHTYCMNAREKYIFRYSNSVVEYIPGHPKSRQFGIATCTHDNV